MALTNFNRLKINDKIIFGLRRGRYGLAIYHYDDDNDDIKKPYIKYMARVTYIDSNSFIIKILSSHWFKLYPSIRELLMYPNEIINIL